MESRRSIRSGGLLKCGEDQENAPHPPPEGLGEAAASRMRLAAEPYRSLDELRRVANGPQRYKLFVRAAVSNEYLVVLSQAGVIVARGRRETRCTLNASSGELRCYLGHEPADDCRLRQCRYAALMRMRLLVRLREAYALERKRLVGR